MNLWAVVREHRALLPEHLEQLVLRRDRAGGLHLTARVRGQTVWRSAALLHVALVRRGVPAVLWWVPEEVRRARLPGRVSRTPPPCSSRSIRPWATG